MKTFFKASVLCVAFVSSACPMQEPVHKPFLSDEVYALRAQKYLDTVTKNGKLELPKKFLEEYLHKRIKVAQLLLDNLENEDVFMANQDLIGEEFLGWLNMFVPKFSFSQCDEYLDARIYCYFSEMVNNNLGFGVRKLLGCYCYVETPEVGIWAHELETFADFELPYAETLEKLSGDEWRKRCKEYCGEGNGRFNEQLLIESKKFAEAILSLLEQ